MRFLSLTLALLLAVTVRAAATPLPAGEPLETAFTRQLLVERLRAAGHGERFEVSIDRPHLPLGNTGKVATEITVEDLDYEPRNGRFQAMLVGRVEAGERFRLPLHGRAPELLSVPVLAHPVAAGARIGEADLDWRSMPAHRLGRGTVTEAARVIGTEARRPLRPGRTLDARDLIAPRLVRRGQPVRLVYARPGLRLSAIGTAQDDGALGAPVRVLNPHSHRQIQGVVSGPDEVAVGGPAPSPS